MRDNSCWTPATFKLNFNDAFNVRILFQIIFNFKYGLFFLFSISSFCNLSNASDRTLTLVGVYSQSNVVFELQTNSPYYNSQKTKADSNMNYGILFETPIQSHWGFESGLIFLKRGYQVPDFFDPSTEQVYRWNSIYIPLVGRFHPTPLFTGSIGLYIDQAVSDVSNYQSSDTSSVQYQTFKQSGFRTFDYGMTYSAGLNVDINSSSKLLIEVRFNESWSNLMDTSLSTVNKQEKATVHETQIYLGFII